VPPEGVPVKVMAAGAVTAVREADEDADSGSDEL
jgi:hypothetical protein